ncbi:hypothetical protein [Cyanobium sp. ATX 6A2]|uniref:hypothetical protein n=1 Tax=Cyanobium sp. ATX 6A2 TaxID=2823700 RepID=UPI0020CEF736|nr:hypothetical protein [Cyanobium sp. ATX 6A2]
MPTMPAALIRGSLLGTALVLTGLMPAPAQAQTLLDVMGAGAIQNTLQTLPAGGASGVIERSRSAVDQSSLAEQQRQQLLQQLSGGGGAAGAPAGLMAPLMNMFMPGAFPGAPGGGAQRTSTAQVNGRLVPYCSHGGLCHGNLMRALRGY